MKAASLMLAGVLLVMADGLAQHEDAAARPVPADRPAVRFAVVDVYVDSGPTKLAAWQVAITATAGDVKLVGIEGGEHAAFAGPPYYDPAAMKKDRVRIAAFSTGADLPTGRTCVARLHVQIGGDEAPEYAVELQAAAGPDGQPVKAQAGTGKGLEK